MIERAGALSATGTKKIMTATAITIEISAKSK